MFKLTRKTSLALLLSLISAFSFLPALSVVPPALAESAASWNPNVSCTATLTRVRDVLGSSYPSQSLTGSPYRTSSTTGGIPNKRTLSPPCSITNTSGQTLSSFVQINGVYLKGLTLEDCSTKYDAVNGGGNYPDRDGDGKPDTYCDSTGNIFQMGTSSGFIHIEIDHDWKAAGYCGAGTFCDDNALTRYVSTGSVTLDVQGFVFWDTEGTAHWELHPFTAWQLAFSTGFTYSPSVPSPGSPVSFTATATGGTSPYTFSWTFGDGASATGNAPTHAYTSLGNYNVTLTTTDSKGQTLKSSKIIAVRTQGFSFGAAGDFESLTSGTGPSNLGMLQSLNLDFFLGLGDFSSDSSVTGDTWCGQFKSQYNNIQILPGDHDTGGHNSAGFGETHSYERYVNGCPLTLNVPLVCGPVAGNCYGKEYYFDYPAANPIARFIFTSPKIYNITGVCTSSPNCSSGTGQPCTDTYGCWQYLSGDIHYKWVKSAIDNGRASGIKWVIVGTHKVCISASDATCSMGIAFFNLLVSEKVDLVIQAHDNAYERSKQIALNGSTCTGFNTDGSGYTVYNSACVVDSGSRGFYTAGAGTVVVIQGAWTSDLYKVNDTSVNGGANAREAPYFVKLMGRNTPGAGFGFTRYVVYSDGIDVQTSLSGNFQDSFSILSTTPPLSAGFTYSPSSPSPRTQVSFTGAASGGLSPYIFSWNFGDGSSGSGNPVAHAYAVAGTYTVVLTVTDSSATPQTATSSRNVSVSTQAKYTLNYQGFDYDGGGEVTLTVNGRFLASLPQADSPQNSGKYISITLNITELVVEGSNNLTFTQVPWDSSGMKDVQITDQSGNVIFSDLTVRTLDKKASFTYTFTIGSQPVHPTATSVACSPSSVVVGQASTCTGTVTDTSGSGATTPTGTLSFTSTGPGSLSASICSLSAGATGTASCSVNFNPSATGAVTVTGSYDGDAGHDASSSSPATITVNKRATSTRVVCSPSSGSIGLVSTCTASVVDSSPGTPSTPAGAVTWTHTNTGELSATTCTLSGGSCSVTYTANAQGSHVITASYGGDSTHATSSNTFTIAIAIDQTSTAVSCTPSTVVISQATSCTATVTDITTPSNTPTGTVNFTPSSSCTLVSGRCSVSITPTAAGTLTVTASYQGDSTHATSSGSTSVTVNPRATSTTINCTPTTAVIGQASSCTATVSDTSPGTTSTPTGTITWSHTNTGAFSAATCTLVIGSCSVSYTPGTIGSHVVTGSYSGDTTHATSLGQATINVGVTLDPTTTSVSCSPRSVVINQPTTCTATVTDTAALGATAPTGTVTFSPSGSCTLANPTATSASCSVSITPTTTGTLTVSASYSGDLNHSGSSGSTSVTVNKRATSTAISCSPNPVTNNTATSCTATVTDNDVGTSITLTGIVTFASNSTGIFTAPNCTLGSTATVGVANCSVSYTPRVPGHHGITGTYDGDSSHTGSSGGTTVTATPPTVASPYALVISEEGKVFKYQNETFTLIGQPFTTPLRQVAWKPDGSYALIVGDSGIILKYDGTQLTTIPTGVTTNIYALAWKPDGSYALISGSGGILFKYDGSVLTRLQNPFANSIRSISWNPAGTQALMVGSSGGMLLYQSNGAISQISSGTTQYLYSSAWNPNGLYALAAGANNVILRYDGTSVQALNAAGLYSATVIIHAISWNPSGSFALLVGDSGVVLTYDGTSLTLVPSPAPSNLYSISWLGATAYITGGTGPGLTYTGGVLSKLANNTLASLRWLAWKPK